MAKRCAVGLIVPTSKIYKNEFAVSLWSSVGSGNVPCALCHGVSIVRHLLLAARAALMIKLILESC